MLDQADLQAPLAGRYAIRRELGRGGMAVVMLADDLKPENVRLAGDQALLADFGVARVTWLDDKPETLTAIGTTVGTPHYMSPEQATADRVLDARSDVYSLACVCYELLSGHPPFTDA